MKDPTPALERIAVEEAACLEAVITALEALEGLGPSAAATQERPGGPEALEQHGDRTGAAHPTGEDPGGAAWGLAPAAGHGSRAAAGAPSRWFDAAPMGS